MTQSSSDPTRADDPHALTNVEIFYISRSSIDHMEAGTEDEGSFCGPGWYWWASFPGCIPDSDSYGPFDTEADALTDAQFAMRGFHRLWQSLAS
jgi:hypothetical protein